MTGSVPAEHVLRQTSTPEAPWTIIEGADPRYRYLAVGKAILEALRAALMRTETFRHTSNSLPPIIPTLDKMSVLNKLDLSLKLSKNKYKNELEKYQGKLNLLTRDADFRKLSVVAVFEGWDAAGKGRTIRRITAAWMQGSTALFRLRPRPRKSGLSPISGDSGGTLRAGAVLPSLTVHGTGA